MGRVSKHRLKPLLASKSITKHTCFHNSDRMENVSILDLAQIIVAICTIITLLFLIMQIRAQNNSLKNQVYTTFVNGALEIDKILIQYPKLRKYVVDKEPIDPNLTEEEIARLMSIEELVIDSLENIEAYKDSIPESQLRTWEDYGASMKDTSGFRFYMENTSHPYYKNNGICEEK